MNKLKVIRPLTDFIAGFVIPKCDNMNKEPGVRFDLKKAALKAAAFYNLHIEVLQECMKFALMRLEPNLNYKSRASWIVDANNLFF